MNSAAELPHRGPIDYLYDILLVEDNLGDVRLTQEALAQGSVRSRLHVARDGAEAMRFLKREGTHANAPRPDLILLDLNLPKKNGREVLAEIKEDPFLKRIPVVILTISEATADIVEIYDLHANCYVTKPVDLERFVRVIHAIERFWLNIAQLPSNVDGARSHFGMVLLR